VPDAEAGEDVVVVHPVQQSGQAAIVMQLVESSGLYDVLGVAEITPPLT
jgi:hypothetical protein